MVHQGERRYDCRQVKQLILLHPASESREMKLVLIWLSPVFLFIWSEIPYQGLALPTSSENLISLDLSHSHAYL